MSDAVIVLVAHVVISLAALGLAAFIIWVDPAPLDHPTAIFIVGAVTGYWFGNGATVFRDLRRNDASRR